MAIFSLEPCSDPGDAADADEVFDMHMGDQVLPRTKFIQSHAKYARNLDP